METKCAVLNLGKSLLSVRLRADLSLRLADVISSPIYRSFSSLFFLQLPQVYIRLHGIAFPCGLVGSLSLFFHTYV